MADFKLSHTHDYGCFFASSAQAFERERGACWRGKNRSGSILLDGDLICIAATSTTRATVKILKKDGTVRWEQEMDTGAPAGPNSDKIHYLVGDSGDSEIYVLLLDSPPDLDPPKIVLQRFNKGGNNWRFRPSTGSTISYPEAESLEKHGRTDDVPPDLRATEDDEGTGHG
jgi:hypothetical protein